MPRKPRAKGEAKPASSEAAANNVEQQAELYELDPEIEEPTATSVAQEPTPSEQLAEPETEELAQADDTQVEAEREEDSTKDTSVSEAKSSSQRAVSPASKVSEFTKAIASFIKRPSTADDSDWQKDDGDTVARTPSPRDDQPNPGNAFSEATRDDLKNVKTHELRIKVAPNETNKNVLDVAESAIVSSPSLEGRTIHREATRCVVEVGLRPVSIELAITQDLERCVVVKAYEPVPENLFNILRDSFAKQVQLSSKVSNNLAGVEEEHEESVDGPSVSSLLDPEYVEMIKREMRQRSERDLTAFATPLERRARDEEKRVKRLEQLLKPKYDACRLPLPTAEKPPPLSSFPLQPPEAPSKLTLRNSPTPREVDAQLKMALRRDLHGESLARQERKKKEVLARSAVCERNRFQLVSVLSNSRAAFEVDKELMEKLGVQPPQVALSRVACVHSRKPGFLIITQSMIIFEPLGMFGYRMGGLLKFRAENCRSVMKGQTHMGIVDSLCLRTDSNEEFNFYMATIEDTNEKLDMVFELIWEVLRMNRWVPPVDSVTV